MKDVDKMAEALKAARLVKDILNAMLLNLYSDLMHTEAFHEERNSLRDCPLCGGKATVMYRVKATVCDTGLAYTGSAHCSKCKLEVRDEL